MPDNASSIVILNTGLFADKQTVSAAIEQMVHQGAVQTFDLDVSEMNDKDWDDVLVQVLSAAKVITN